MIFPIGRDTSLTKIPWFTALIILGSLAVFFNTWPDEKAFLAIRWADSPLVSESKALASIALDDGPTLPLELRTKLEDLRAHAYFPDAESDKILQAIQKNFDYLPTMKRPDWDVHFTAYTQARKEAMEERIPWSSILTPLALRPGDSLWPGILTHLFAHAGWLHFIFCMLFLWIVGCNIEERWGPIITPLLFLSGGTVSAAVLLYSMSAGDWMLLGSSGAVAALVGAFLVRHFNLPIRFFYALGVTFGTFTLPAWTLMLLWLPGLYYMGFLTGGRLEGMAAHIVHGTGFAYGVLMGLIVDRGHIAKSWERSADSSPMALDQRAEAAGRLFTGGKAQAAQAAYEEILELDPRHLAALQGLLAAHEFFQNEEGAAKTAVRVIRTAVERGRGQTAEEVFRRWSLKLFQVKMTPQERLGLAQNLETMQLWREALAYYRAVAEQGKDSPFAGKALFSSAMIYKNHMSKPEDAVQILRKLLDAPYDLEWRALAEAELRALGK